MRIARGWLPDRLAHDGSAIEVVDLAGHSLQEPFLAQTIEGARFSEAGLRSAWIPIDEFEAWSPFPEPAAFLLHTARCGSTLLSHLLQLAGFAVAKEPMIVSDLLFALYGLEPRTTRDRAERLLAPVMAQLAGDVLDPPRPLIVKLTAWDSGRCQPLLDRWPDVPVIGVTREPVGVVASQLRRAPDYRDRLFGDADTLRRWFEHLPLSTETPPNALELHASIWAGALDTLLEIGSRALLLDYEGLVANPWGTLGLALDHVDAPGTHLPDPSAVRATTAVDAWDHSRTEVWAPSTRVSTSDRTRSRVLTAVGPAREEARRAKLRHADADPPATGARPPPSPPGQSGGDVRRSGPLVVTLRPRPEVLAAYRSLTEVPAGPADFVAPALLSGFGPDAGGLGRRPMTEVEHLVALGTASIEVHHDHQDHKNHEDHADRARPAHRAAPQELYRLVAADLGAERAFLSGRRLAEAVGYPVDELEAAGDTVDGLVGLGNPFALGDIRPGDRVVDVGCGNGTDVRLAARRVGPEGLVLGIDRVPEMLDRASRAATRTGVTNASFVEAAANSLPVPDATTDVVVANGMLAMAGDKGEALREMGRILREGGALHAADQVWETAATPTALERWNAALVGATMIADWEDALRGAGFDDVEWGPPRRPFAAEFRAGDLTVRSFRAVRSGRTESTAPAPSASWHLHMATDGAADWAPPDLDREIGHHEDTSLTPVGYEGLLWGPRWRTPAFLSTTATLLWQATETPVTIGELAEDLTDIIGLPPLIAEAQCLDFARSLGSSGHLATGTKPEPPSDPPLPYVSPLFGAVSPDGAPMIAPLVADGSLRFTTLVGGRLAVTAPVEVVGTESRFTSRPPEVDDRMIRLALIADGPTFVLLSDLGVPLWRGPDPEAARLALGRAMAGLEGGDGEVRLRLHALDTRDGVILLQPEFAYAAIEAAGQLTERGCQLLPTDLIGIDSCQQAIIGHDEPRPVRAIVMGRTPDGGVDWTAGRWAWALALSAVAVDLGQPLDQAMVTEAILRLLGSTTGVTTPDFSVGSLMSAVSGLLTA